MKNITIKKLLYGSDYLPDIAPLTAFVEQVEAEYGRKLTESELAHVISTLVEKIKCMGSKKKIYESVYRKNRQLTAKQTSTKNKPKPVKTKITAKDKSYINAKKPKQALTAAQRGKKTANKIKPNAVKLKESVRNRLGEAVDIKDYPVQAIGRKRNQFMNALQLDTNEFNSWVTDRLYRVAERNDVPVKSLNYKDIIDGMQKWKDTFQQKDQEWNQFSGAFEEYSKKFLDASETILKQNINNPNGQPAPQSAPMSPTMVKNEKN